MDKTIVSGIVLSTSPQGEYDKRIVILTKDRGRITAFARGARKEHSSLLGATNSFVYADFDVYEGRNAYTLVGANVKNHFPYFSTNLKEASLGYYFLEFMNHFTNENNDEYENLKLLYMALCAISDSRHDLELSRTVFVWKYLVINGIYPSNDSYSNLMQSTRYALDYLISCDLKDTFNFKLRDLEKNEFIKFVDDYFNKTNKYKFKSLDFYKQI